MPVPSLSSPTLGQVLPPFMVFSRIRATKTMHACVAATAVLQDSDLVRPTATGGRVLLIGDVHGCLIEVAADCRPDLTSAPVSYHRLRVC